MKINYIPIHFIENTKKKSNNELKAMEYVVWESKVMFPHFPMRYCAMSYIQLSEFMSYIRFDVFSFFLFQLENLLQLSIQHIASVLTVFSRRWSLYWVCVCGFLCTNSINAPTTELNFGSIRWCVYAYYCICTRTLSDLIVYAIRILIGMKMLQRIANRFKDVGFNCIFHIFLFSFLFTVHSDCCV